MARRDVIKKESCVPVMTLKIRNVPDGFPSELEVEMPMYEDLQQVKHDVDWLKKNINANTVINIGTAVAVIIALIKVLGLS